MEKDDILAEPAGRLLDCLIMEKIFGVETTPVGDDDWYSGIPARPIPLFSTNIADTWDVVDKMEENDYWFSLSNVVPNSDPIVYEVRFNNKSGGGYACEFTVPLAICHAALLAVS